MNRLKADATVNFAARDIAPVSGTPQYATGGSPPSIPATIDAAYMFNQMMDELMSIQEAAGIAPDDTQWGLVWASILRAHTFLDTGSAAAFIVNPPSMTWAFPAAALGVGTSFRFYAANAPAAGATMNFAGSGVHAIVRQDRLPIVGGEWGAGQIVELAYNGTNFQTLSQIPVGPILQIYGAGSFTFVVPAGINKLYGEVVGGGGSGASAGSTSNAGGGGGAGGYAALWFSVTPGEIINIVCGAGGGTALGGGANGNAGTASSITCTNVSIIGAGGNFGGSISFGLGSGGYGAAGSASGSALLGGSIVQMGGDGTDGGGATPNLAAGNGGASFFGGGSRGSTTGGLTPRASGSGGGGSYGGALPVSSAGADGRVILRG